MNVTMYVVGIVLHALWKWARWSGSGNGWNPGAWLKASGATNIQAAICAIVCMFLWEQGWLAIAVNSSVSTLFGGAMPELQVNGWSSLAAGYMLDSAGRGIIEVVESRLGKKAND